jgi:hypothetical protein
MNRSTFLACLKADVQSGRYSLPSGMQVSQSLYRLTARELAALTDDARAMLLHPYHQLNRRAVEQIAVKSGGDLRGIKNAPEPQPNVKRVKTSSLCRPVRPLYACRKDAVNKPIVIPVTPEKEERLRQALGVPSGYLSVHSDSLERHLKRQRRAWWAGAGVLAGTLTTLYVRGVIPFVGLLTCLMLSTLFLWSLRRQFRC